MPRKIIVQLFVPTGTTVEIYSFVFFFSEIRGGGGGGVYLAHHPLHNFSPEVRGGRLHGNGRLQGTLQYFFLYNRFSRRQVKCQSVTRLRSASLSHDLRSASLSHDLRSASLSHDFRSASLSHDLRSASLSHDFRSASLSHDFRSASLSHDFRSASLKCSRGGR